MSARLRTGPDQFISARDPESAVVSVPRCTSVVDVQEDWDGRWQEEFNKALDEATFDESGKHGCSHSAGGVREVW